MSRNAPWNYDGARGASKIGCCISSIFAFLIDARNGRIAIGLRTPKAAGQQRAAISVV
jgi:hypothetical protein